MVERYDESAGRARARFLSDPALGRLGEAMVASEASGARHQIPANIVRLLLMTGARVNEIVTMRREYVDLDRGLAQLPDSKAGAKTILLSASARQLLAISTGDGPKVGYLFPSPPPATGAGERPYAGLKRFWNAMRSAAQLGDARVHDLRHTHASVGVAGSFSLLLVGKLLGHSQAPTTEPYAHLADDPVRQAGDVVGNRIAAALIGNAADILPLQPAPRRENE